MLNLLKIFLNQKNDVFFNFQLLKSKTKRNSTKNFLKKNMHNFYVDIVGQNSYNTA
ncbi:hypothetical protein ABIE26_000589 [Pedobacter africanus]|uniref:Uncharacterized protein n=1 Tax=Pedobacter africanus TaxID=151894 RepID=A0ACC6KU84_9SPHI|nr:hypothetical protein [Pedobacter africanus]